MDLTRQPPRRPSNLGVAGIVGAARMTDKARAAEEELLGEYKYGRDSGLDRDVLEFIGMEAEDFVERAVELDDAALGELVLQNAGRRAEEIGAFNRYRLEQTPQDELHERLLVERIARYAPGNTSITTVLQSMELDDWGAFRDRDLTARPPRTPYLRSVAGIAGAARMADKARAARSGNPGEYRYGHVSPLDRRILETLGIAEEDFVEGAYENPNDDELSEWIAARSEVSKGAISMLNGELCDMGIRTPVLGKRFAKRRGEICPDRPDVETFFDLIDIDDQQSFGIVDLTRRPPRSPYERSIGGVMGLARMLDKARAFASGHLGEYYFGDDSGFDRWVMELLGLTQEEVVGAAREHATDEAFAAWLGSRLDRSEAEIAVHNERLSEYSPGNERQERFFAKAIANLDRSRTDIRTFAALSLLDDAIVFARLHAGT